MEPKKEQAMDSLIGKLRRAGSGLSLHENAEEDKSPTSSAEHKEEDLLGGCEWRVGSISGA